MNNKIIIIKILDIFFIVTVILDKLSANGKSICEVRAKMNEKFNFNQAEQIAFSDD